MNTSARSSLTGCWRGTMLVKLYRLATTSQPGSRGRRHYYEV